MGDLLSQLQSATAEDQKAVVGYFIEHAYRQGWCSQDERLRLIRLWKLGGLESVAVSLVPEGWAWNVQSKDRSELSGTGIIRANANVWPLGTEPTMDKTEFAETSCLALCIAIIKAHESKAEAA